MKALYFIKDNKIIIDINFLSGKIVKYDLISCNSIFENYIWRTWTLRIKNNSFKQ